MTLSGQQSSCLDISPFADASVRPAPENPLQMLLPKPDVLVLKDFDLPKELTCRVPAGKPFFIITTFQKMLKSKQLK